MNVGADGATTTICADFPSSSERPPSGRHSQPTPVYWYSRPTITVYCDWPDDSLMMTTDLLH